MGYTFILSQVCFSNLLPHYNDLPCIIALMIINNNNKQELVSTKFTSCKIFIYCIVVVVLCGCSYLMCICCTVCVYVCVCVWVCVCVHYCIFFTLDAGLLARSQYSEGPATGHLDTGFSCFLCVYKQMLRWFPRFQVATTCFSCSPPDLNSVVTDFMFCVHVK